MENEIVPELTLFVCFTLQLLSSGLALLRDLLMSRLEDAGANIPRGYYK